MPINSRPNRRTTVAIIVTLWCAALAGASLLLAAGDDPAVLPTAVTPTLPDDASTDASSSTAAPSADQSVADPPTDDEPTADDPAVDPDQPVDPDEPDPQPDPDPQPQVPLGADDLAPLPEPPPPTCPGDCVAPVDLHPIEQESGSPAAPLPVAGNDTAGCSVHCITRAQALTLELDSTNVEVEVVTHTPATIEVYVSDQAPQVSDSGRPFFPGVRPSDRTEGDLDEYFATTLTDLAEETEYWMIVRATDEQGRGESVTGSVVTRRLDDDVEVIFAAIDIIYDGDKGRNKGELSFMWGVGLQTIGSNGEYHRGDGSRIDLDGQINSYARLDLDGSLQQLWVTGREKDPRQVGQGWSGCHAEWQDFTGAGTDDGCGEAWNTTLSIEPTIADIEAMADCTAFDLGDEFDGYRCTRISTVQSFGGIPEFSVVIAFKVF